jgi:predicted transcriptional regulator
MGKIEKRRLPGNMNIMPSKRANIVRPQRRKRSGIYLESTEAEQLGVLPEECTRVKDAMSRSVYTVTPSTEIEEAVRLMKSLGVGAVLVCQDRTLVGILSDRDIALANAPPSEPVHKVMTDPGFCDENDLLVDVLKMMRARDLHALPVKDFNGTFSGIVMRTE